ncbi:MAG TPA: hypothetical protein VGL73_16645 [Caulobacteraceae bacterium]|jgi:hypothetical protein
MRPPGPSLRVSGGDYVLGGLWLKPAQVDALLAHHWAALAAARDPAAATHHTAWLHDLGRVVAERARHRRAAGVEAA